MKLVINVEYAFVLVLSSYLSMSMGWRKVISFINTDGLGRINIASCGPIFDLGASYCYYNLRSFKVILTKFDYEVNSNFVDAKIQILNNTGETELNIAVNILENLDDIQVKAIVFLETTYGNYTELLNRSIHFCKFLKQRSSEPLFRVIYEDLQRYGKLFKECPIKKGSYTVQEYRIDEEMLPSYLPETNFMISLHMKLKTADVLIFNGTLMGTIDKSKGFNNLKMFSMG